MPPPTDKPDFDKRGWKMSENKKLTILCETFKKDGSDEDIQGLTLMLDGVMRKVFDKMKNDFGYTSDADVLTAVIFEGVNSIIEKNK